MRLFTSTLVLISFLASVGCAGGGLVDVPVDVCSTGRQWQGLETEDDRMHPGRDCISCHAAKPFGPPKLSIAGTVYSQPDADECGGVEGAVVELTGADGTVTTLTTNEAGNFYTEAVIKFPYRAKVTLNGKTSVMATAQSVGSCNSCHTQTGLNGAPGRILVAQ